MKKWLSISLVLFVLIQFVTVVHDNPESNPQNEIQVVENVHSILKTACYDCHSNQSVWPWYSYVAPVSWFVADHVHEARHKLNFSEWQTMPEKRRNKRRDQTAEEVDEGDMPLPPYVLLHPGAKLSSEQIAVLKEWSQSAAPDSLKKDVDKEGI